MITSLASPREPILSGLIQWRHENPPRLRVIHIAYQLVGIDSAANVAVFQYLAVPECGPLSVHVIEPTAIGRHEVHVGIDCRHIAILINREPTVLNSCRA
ncbi:hypothetical protein D3C75_1161640 [compost metagenome]